MDRSEFLKTFFQYCGGKIELRVFGKSNDQKFFNVDDAVNIEAFVKRYERSNVFFGVGTRDGKAHNGTRGGKSNLVEIPAVWCDVDFKDTPRELAAQNLKNFPFKPSIIVQSGGGAHFYWVLKEAADKSEIEKIEDINRRIAAALGGDMIAVDASRVLRLPGTFNFKYDPPRPVNISRNDSHFYDLDDFINILPEVKSGAGPLGQAPEGRDNTTGWLTELMRGVAEGGRDQAAAKIAGYFLNKLPAGDVLNILRTWNQSNTPPLDDKDLLKVVNSVSRYEHKTDKPKIDISNVFDSAQMIAAYQTHIKSLTQNQFKTGIKPIDYEIRGVAGGEVLVILARAGTFKTAILQNLLFNYSQRSGHAAAFFSIEMPVASLTERYLGILDGSTGREVEGMYLDPARMTERSAAERQFKSDLENLYVIDAVISVSDIQKYLGLIESEKSKKVGVIGVDYLGLLEGPGHNVYETVSRVAKEVKQMAKSLNVPVVLLCQTSRKGGDGEKEIMMDMARDSGVIEEGADFILGLYQVDSDTVIVGGDDSPRFDVICKILKNRKGRRNSQFRLDLDPSTFRLGPNADPYTPPKVNRGGF